MSPRKQTSVQNVVPVQFNVPGYDTVAYSSEDGLKIKTSATLASVAENRFVRHHFNIIGDAIRAVHVTKTRNLTTVGEDLTQESRCWYYRRKSNCWLSGGDLCFAKNGDNPHLALFGCGPCYTVHPSDTAAALIALGAEITIFGPGGEYTLPLGKFFRLPRESSRKLTVLENHEFITEVCVPAVPANSKGIYIKAMNRQVWAFALAGLAVQANFEGDVITDAALVLTGVAPAPWRLPDVEMLLQGNKLNDKSIAAAAGIAVNGALPLSHNGYKIALIKGLITEALNSLKS